MRIRSFLVLLTVLLLTSSSAFPAEKPVVRFGVGLRYHPIVVYEHFQPMMDYLTRNTPYRFELKLSRGYEATINAFVKGETDMISSGDGGLMNALMRGAVPVLKPLDEQGKAVYRAYFVVRADSGIRSLQDLKGKRVGFGSRHSTSGNLITRYMLEQQGIRLEQLGSVKSLRNHTAVVTAVLKGEIDAGAVKSTVADHYRHHGLRVIASSEDLPSVPLLMRKDVPKEVVTAVTRALVKLDARKPADRKLMASWDNEYRHGFVPANAAEYQGVMQKFRRIPYGCGRGCHK